MPATKKQTVKTGIKTGVMTITPKMATDWLEKNTRNRKLRSEIALEYAEALHTGHWMLTGEAIIFDSDGVLVDGQHRLEGIRIAQIEAQSVVVQGVVPEAFECIGAGYKRSAAQVLKMRGEDYSSVLAASTNVARKIIEGSLSDSTRFSTWERIAFIEEHPRLRKSAAFIGGNHWLYMHCASRGVVTSVHYFAAKKHGIPKTESFFVPLMSGEMLAKGSPILALREWLVAQKKERFRLPWGEIYQRYHQAWSAYLLGDELKYVTSIAPLEFQKKMKLP